MVSRKILNMIMALALAVALSSGAFVHALVPHEHSHGNEAANGIWDSVHSALRGEDKKMLGALPLAFHMQNDMSLAILVFVIGKFSLDCLCASRKDPDDLELALRRGTLAYRAFG